jgi:hypothetical protein
VHRERLVGARTRLINELSWQLHDLWPDWQITGRSLPDRYASSRSPGVELTATINRLHQELVQLLTERGPGFWPSQVSGC